MPQQELERFTGHLNGAASWLFSRLLSYVILCQEQLQIFVGDTAGFLPYLCPNSYPSRRAEALSTQPRTVQECCQYLRFELNPYRTIITTYRIWQLVAGNHRENYPTINHQTVYQVCWLSPLEKIWRSTSDSWGWCARWTLPPRDGQDMPPEINRVAVCRCNMMDIKITKK